jgi:hypothetical protein
MPSTGEQNAPAEAGEAPPAATAQGRRRTFALYPTAKREELLAAGRDVRTIHMVRHAQVSTEPHVARQAGRHVASRTETTARYLRVATRAHSTHAVLVGEMEMAERYNPSMSTYELYHRRRQNPLQCPLLTKLL